MSEEKRRSIGQIYFEKVHEVCGLEVPWDNLDEFEKQAWTFRGVDALVEGLSIKLLSGDFDD